MNNSSVAIKIGLLQNTALWQLLLDQIGVDWSTVEENKAIAISDYSALIINRSISIKEQSLLSDYVLSGGAVIYAVKDIFPKEKLSLQTKFTTSLPPQQNDEYSFTEIFDLYQEIHLFDNDLLVKILCEGEGLISHLGFDCESIVTNTQLKRKSFYAETERLPNERVSKYSKNALRQFLHSHLEYLHHKRNLPFVHKWFFPRNEPTLFTFRVDSDKGNQDEIEEIYQLSKKNCIPTTWFLDVKSHEPWLDYFNKFIDQEIGIHCYEHIVYNSQLLNKENFEKAFLLLKKYKIHTKGIAAPTGEWNTNIGSAMEELNFEYSSEFGYDYDNLPSFPVLNSNLSSVLQLPIHPMCVGTLRRAHMTSTDMIDYFKHFIDRNIILREPICLYQHPAHRQNEVFDKVFEYINSKKVLTMSYSEYSEWWKERKQFQYHAVWNGSNIHCQFTQGKNAWLRISIQKNKETIVAAKNELLFNSMQWNSSLKQTQIPKDIMRARKFSLQHVVQNALDWWIKITE